MRQQAAPKDPGMRFSTIRLEQQGAAAVITLDRPDRRNAISLRMTDEIVAACAEVASQAGARSLIVTGGQEVFSSGADLNEALAVTTPEQGERFFGGLRRLNAALEALEKPVIAAIEGPCMTGGCELALACDLRIAGEGASFAITSARIGTIAGAGGTQRLPRIVGLSNALAMLFSAAPIDAEEALRIGLINRKAGRGTALAEALALAAGYAACAPLSLALAKRAVRDGMDLQFAAGLDLELALVSAIYRTRDKHEGISAFLEKRKPRFEGR
jgi:enoyl-CoA hydratase/carnithine racemase